jgi:hypothetical protein
MLSQAGSHAKYRLWLRAEPFRGADRAGLSARLEELDRVRAQKSTDDPLIISPRTCLRSIPPVIFDCAAGRLRMKS